MDTKHYLSQISVLDLKISNKIYEKTQLKNMLCSVPSCVKDVNVQTGHATDKTASTICKLVDMEREIDSMIDYNINDVNSTEELLNRCKKDIDLRIAIEDEYGVRVLSKDGVNIGMKILTQKYLEKTGRISFLEKVKKYV